MKPKILIFDCETAPIPAYIFRTGEQYVSHDQIMSGWKPGIICICYKWLGENKVHCLDWGYHAQNTGKIVEAFDKIVQKADVVIAHNGDGFDLKHLNTHRLLNNLPPLDWIPSEDTLKQIRKHFYLPSNSLDYVSKLLFGEGKNKMCLADWVDIVEKKDKKAYRKMLDYCKKDVDMLAKIVEKIAPYVRPKVHRGIVLGNGKKGSCPSCGKTSLSKRGFLVKLSGKYQRYQCTSCGHFTSDSQRVKE